MNQPDQRCTTADTALTSSDRCGTEECRTQAENWVEPSWRSQRDDHAVVVEVELPGVAKDALVVEAKPEGLLIEGSRRLAGDTTRVVYGSPAPDGYRLKLRVGDKLDAPSMTAKLEAGVLRLEIPVAEEARPRRIEVG